MEDSLSPSDLSGLCAVSRRRIELLTVEGKSTVLPLDQRDRKESRLSTLRLQWGTLLSPATWVYLFQCVATIRGRKPYKLPASLR